MSTDSVKPLPNEWAAFPRFFAALGDSVRQQILLVFQSNEEVCVTEIASRFSLSRPAISHHLKVLRDAQILLSIKRGKEVYYRINGDYCAHVLRVVQNRLVAPAQAHGVASAPTLTAVRGWPHPVS